jgi:hypothetical protein
MHVDLRQARHNAKRSKECDLKQNRASAVPKRIETEVANARHLYTPYH